MEQTKAIEIKDLCFGYRGNWNMLRGSGLKDISLEVFQNESFGFLGRNGAGKTTTIKCLLDLLRPNSGSTKIFGIDSRNVLSRRNIGYVPEQPYFYDYIKVKETVRMYAALAEVPHKELDARVAEALELVKITYKSKANLRSLSKGQTQRVAIAQAIVAKPKLLILDEPFSGLDPVGRKEICDLFFYLKEQGTTIFICSHILSDIEFLCDRVSIMAKGQILGIYDLKDLPRLTKGKYELVLSSYQKIEDQVTKLADHTFKQDLFLRLNFEDAQKAKEALSIAIESEAHIESYNFAHSSLEDLFVNLVGENTKG